MIMMSIYDAFGSFRIGKWRPSEWIQDEMRERIDADEMMLQVAVQAEK